MSKNRGNSNAGKDSVVNPTFTIGTLKWILFLAVLSVAGVNYGYYRAFAVKGESSQSSWGQFGDYVGGTLNPILSFLSLIALLLTVVLQIRQLEIAHEQLENSKDELEATREELKKSSAAQQQTAAALQEQAKYAVFSARIAALRASLEISTESLAQAQVAGVLAGPNTYQKLLRRKEELASEILRLTGQLCEEKTGV